MIHLDSYIWEGKTYIRTWDTEVPMSVAEYLATHPGPIQVIPVEHIEPKPDGFLAGFWPPRWLR